MRGPLSEPIRRRKWNVGRSTRPEILREKSLNRPTFFGTQANGIVGATSPGFENLAKPLRGRSSRAKTEGEVAIPLGGRLPAEKFQTVWFPSVGRKWAVRQYRFLLPVSRRSAPGGGRFGRNRSSTCAAKSQVWRNGLQGGRGIRYGTGRNRPNRLVGEATKGRISGLMATYRDDGCRPKVLLS